MSLGQPWYNLILLPFFSYGGGLMDQFADTVVRVRTRGMGAYHVHLSLRACIEY